MNCGFRARGKPLPRLPDQTPLELQFPSHLTPANEMIQVSHPLGPSTLSRSLSLFSSPTIALPDFAVISMTCHANLAPVSPFLIHSTLIHWVGRGFLMMCQTLVVIPELEPHPSRRVTSSGPVSLLQLPSNCKSFQHPRLLYPKTDPQTCRNSMCPRWPLSSKFLPHIYHHTFLIWIYKASEIITSPVVLLY
ncbi:hypothetical protein BDZ91DRAFT_399146 [Kalaharituber pfeilii]|nr:hypothetical protein BDZ91DRAFT_399146 [Kalaharituber pfeilii]